MLSIGTVVMTVEDLPRAVIFWRAALGYVERSPATDDWVILDPPGARHGDARGASLGNRFCVVDTGPSSAA